MKTLALFVSLLVPLAVSAQCGPNGCVVPQRAPAVIEELKWSEIPLDSVKYPKYAGGQYALFAGTKQIGAWNAETGAFRYLNPDGNFSNIVKCPIATPGIESRLKSDNTVANYGIDTEQMKRKPASPCTMNGRPVSFEDAINAVKFPDDSGKLRVTAVGSPQDTEAVKQQLVAAGLGDKVLFQEYLPTDEVPKRSGFQPGVTMQNPTGPVAHRQEGYGNVAEAVRKVRPDYDPKKDPNVTAPTLLTDPLEYAKALPWYVWAIVVAVGYKLYTDKQKVNGAK